jgi:hypothetical protein
MLLRRHHQRGRRRSDQSDQETIVGSDVVDTQQEDSQVDNTQQPSGSQPQKKRRKKDKDAEKPINLSKEVEDALVDWVQDNPCLYDKCTAAFKETHTKEKLWKEKTDSLDVSVTD